MCVKEDIGQLLVSQGFWYDEDGNYHLELSSDGECVVSIGDDCVKTFHCTNNETHMTDECSLEEFYEAINSF